MPLIKKWIFHPKKGGIFTKSISEIAKNITQEKDPRLIQKAFLQDPELLLEFYKKFIEIEKEMYLAMLSDRENARKRTTKIQSGIFLFVIILGLSLCIGILCYAKVPKEVIGVLSTLCGILGACLKDVYAFEFSSSNSHRPTDLRQNFY